MIPSYTRIENRMSATLCTAQIPPFRCRPRPTGSTSPAAGLSDAVDYTYSAWPACHARCMQSVRLESPMTFPRSLTARLLLSVALLVSFGRAHAQQLDAQEYGPSPN